jgi:hypothetical protein
MSELPFYQPPVALAESAHVARSAAYDRLAAEAAADYSGFWSRLARGFVSWKTPQRRLAPGFWPDDRE